MLNEGIGAMEKQPPRQSPGTYKGNGAVERKNDFSLNRNNRQRKWRDAGARSQESFTPSRPAQKWTKPNGDKRPRPRGSYEDRQREEVAEEEDSFEEPIFAPTSRKGNGNHLLSFQYDRRGAQQANWSHYKGPTRSKYNYKAVRYNKEQFLQASYQFVVRDTGRYIEQAKNPDALVDWDLVELVRYLTAEEIQCSICLTPPMAGKITKCGHTFCWACILHYLSIDESESQGCPLCHQYIASDQLRSIQFVTVPEVKVGQEIEMKLMRKNKGGVYVCPSSNWLDKGEEPLNIHDGVATAFNKVLLASSEQIYSEVIQLEKKELGRQLASAEDYETGYIAMAQDLLKKRELDLQERIRHTSCSSATTEDEVSMNEEDKSEEATPLPPGMSFDGTQISTTYADAFENETDSGNPLNETDSGNPLNETDSGLPSTPAENPKSKEDSSSEEAFPFENFNPVESSSEEATPRASEDLSENVEELSLEASGMESEAPSSEVTDQDEMPSKPAVKGQARRPNKEKNVFYFYQAASGQHIYLHHLNAACLTREYGDLEYAPDTVIGTVVEIERRFIDEERRARFRYMNHLPLTCEIQIVELKLKSPVISKETQKAFQAEFDKRKKTRQRNQRADKTRARKIEAEYRRKNPELYSNSTYVSSAQYSRSHSTSELSEASGGSTPVDQPGSQNPAPGEELSTSVVDEAAATMSFAQIIKSGKSMMPSSLSPRIRTLSNSSSAPSLNQPGSSVSVSTEEEEEEGRPPNYADSMLQAWGNVSFMTPAKKDESPASTQPGGGKKKKKKEKQVLFSTAMARKN